MLKEGNVESAVKVESERCHPETLLSGNILEAAQSWCISNSVAYSCIAILSQFIIRLFVAEIAVAFECYMKETTKSMSVSREEQKV